MRPHLSPTAREAIDRVHVQPEIDVETLLQHFPLREVVAYVEDRNAVRGISDWIVAQGFDGPPTERDARAPEMETQR